MEFITNAVAFVVKNDVVSILVAVAVVAMLLGKRLPNLSPAVVAFAGCEAALRFFAEVSLFGVIAEMFAPLMSGPLAVAALVALGAVAVIAIGSEISMRRLKKESAAEG
ncbi:MAG: hypothetical protein OSB62_07220 [Alphaproteobacteria bacterium]|nr:hypothetical protein [Alphaproteobacteria bacterium]